MNYKWCMFFGIHTAPRNQGFTHALHARNYVIFNTFWLSFKKDGLITLEVYKGLCHWAELLHSILLQQITLLPEWCSVKLILIWKARCRDLLRSRLPKNIVTIWNI